MAKIIWQKRASKALDTHLVYAYSEFGKSTAKRWLTEIAHVETRIASMPLLYTRTFAVREETRVSLLPPYEPTFQADLLLLPILRYSPYC